MDASKKDYTKISWLVASIGIIINILYFSYELILFRSVFTKHFVSVFVEHVVIILLIPLFIVVGLLVGNVYSLKKELEKRSINLEETVKQRTRELEESNKLKDLYADILTHDVLNPLGSVSTAVELKLEDEPGDEDMLIAKRNITRAVELIENANRYSKLVAKDDVELEKVDLGEVLDEVLNDYSPLAMEKNIRIKYKGGRGFTAMGNALLKDVFSNLLSNALKYSHMNTEIAVNIVNGEGAWKVEVADRGEGIKDEDKEKIFERFKRVEKGGVKGTGLGLAIVKKALDLQKGRVWVEDNPGGGSVFTVELSKA